MAFTTAVAILLVVFALAVGLSWMLPPSQTGQPTLGGVATTGSGAPSGAHYNLNLIGMKKTDQLPNDSNQGRRIFVNLQGNSKIYLYPGAFAVLDADATDGKGAFQLPAPSTYLYTVWARAVGKPGGKGAITTCATDPTTLEQVCSINQVLLMRTRGKQLFTDVTKEMTTLCADFNGDGTVDSNECVDIFDPMFQDYLWSYDNNGLKVVQLRFYPVQ